MPNLFWCPHQVLKATGAPGYTTANINFIRFSFNCISYCSGKMLEQERPFPNVLLVASQGRKFLSTFIKII